MQPLLIHFLLILANLLKNSKIGNAKTKIATPYNLKPGDFYVYF